MAGTDLVLDKDVRDWVLIPLTIFIILVKLAMQFVHQVGHRLPALRAGQGALRTRRRQRTDRFMLA